MDKSLRHSSQEDSGHGLRYGVKKSRNYDATIGIPKYSGSKMYIRGGGAYLFDINRIYKENPPQVQS